MTAHDILLAMHAKYGAMQSYQDRGVLRTKFPNEPERDEITFATFFRRPDRFRFEWITEHPTAGPLPIWSHQAVWSDGTGAFLYCGRNGKIEPQESLKMAIAAATGISLLTAHTVSTLLLTEFGGGILLRLQRLTLQDGQCDGVECHRIGGYHPRSGDFYEVFVGVPDLLLRRVSRPGCDVVAYTELRRDIRVDEPIDDPIFQFRPSTSPPANHT